MAETLQFYPFVGCSVGYALRKLPLFQLAHLNALTNFASSRTANHC